MEWHALLNAGKCSIHVHFTGGALTGYGVTPAEFTTSDKVVQHIIENSCYFKNKKIEVLRVTEEEAENKTKSKAAKGCEVLGMSGVAGRPELSKTQVTVSCLEDAKEYLIENHGIVSSKLRSTKSIFETAASLGIEFNGI